MEGTIKGSPKRSHKKEMIFGFEQSVWSKREKISQTLPKGWAASVSAAGSNGSSHRFVPGNVNMTLVQINSSVDNGSANSIGNRTSRLGHDGGSTCAQSTQWAPMTPKPTALLVSNESLSRGKSGIQVIILTRKLVYCPFRLSPPPGRLRPVSKRPWTRTG